MLNTKAIAADPLSSTHTHTFSRSGEHKNLSHTLSAWNFASASLSPLFLSGWYCSAKTLYSAWICSTWKKKEERRKRDKNENREWKSQINVKLFGYLRYLCSAGLFHRRFQCMDNIYIAINFERNCCVCNAFKAQPYNSIDSGKTTRAKSRTKLKVNFVHRLLMLSDTTFCAVECMSECVNTVR